VRAYLAGQEITSYVEETSLQIKDTFAQGAGNMGGSSGRAATCSFKTTLGPANSAVGAGTTISSPQLVRLGEIKIYDASSNLIYGGYASKFSDVTDRTRIYTQVDCYDYWQHLDRTIINEEFTSTSDTTMISYLLGKYAPSITIASLSPPNYVFPDKVLRNLSLQKAIQNIADITGMSVWIDNAKNFYYLPPTSAPAAPFSLSTSPNFSTTFDLNITKFEIDDTSAINRVYFYGGKRLSNDYTQDLSKQVDGKTTDLQLLYYPHKSSDGKYHLKINNGPDLTVGFATGSSTDQTNILKPTGKADALINPDGQVLSLWYAPPAGTTVTLTYRFEYPMVLKYVDQAGYTKYGMYLDATISDENVYDPNVAVQRCKLLCYEQSQGLISIELETWKSGLQAGMLLGLYNPLRGINGQYQIQEVDTLPLGAGKFKYKVSCGAWNWNIIDIVTHQAFIAQAVDDNQVDATNTANINQVNLNSQISSSSSATNIGTPGNYYSGQSNTKSGFFSVTS
jgi:hypothetical protein